MTPNEEQVRRKDLIKGEVITTEIITTEVKKTEQTQIHMEPSSGVSLPGPDDPELLKTVPQAVIPKPSPDVSIEGFKSSPVEEALQEVNPFTTAQSETHQQNESYDQSVLHGKLVDLSDHLIKVSNRIELNLSSVRSAQTMYEKIEHLTEAATEACETLGTLLENRYLRLAAMESNQQHRGLYQDFKNIMLDTDAFNRVLEVDRQLLKCGDLDKVNEAISTCQNVYDAILKRGEDLSSCKMYDAIEKLGDAVCEEKDFIQQQKSIAVKEKRLRMTIKLVKGAGTVIIMGALVGYNASTDILAPEQKQVSMVMAGAGAGVAFSDLSDILKELADSRQAAYFS